MLHPVLRSSVQKTLGSVGVDLEKGHKDDPGDGTGKAEKTGIVQPGQEKAL